MNFNVNGEKLNKRISPPKKKKRVSLINHRSSNSRSSKFHSYDVNDPL
jgi:hypothetical protein